MADGASQQNLIVTPVSLYDVTGGKTEEKGSCACAIVGTAVPQLRYTLLCYNERREVLCRATITSSNEHSLQMAFLTEECATFHDDIGKEWQVMFLRQTDVEMFCAQLAIAIYGASGQPTHTPVIADLASPARRTSAIALGQRGKARYTAFGAQQGAAGQLPVVTGSLETNGDMLYTFEVVQSAFAMSLEGKGFESSVVGMAPDSRRLVVVPSAMPRNGATPLAKKAPIIVYVVTLVRIATNDLPNAVVQPNAPLIIPGATPAAQQAGMELALVAAPKDSAAVPADERPAGMKEGSGVPSEHMLLVQKLAAQLNTATTTLRDLQDRIQLFNDDWKQHQNRPKPSVLSNQALEQNVKQLVLEADRVKDELSRRDELIRTLDERNRELQKRVDRAAVMAHELMDGKKDVVSKTSDMRLELDRQVMKLQEQISRSRAERDDVARHLQTVKKLLEMSDAELRNVKGKAEVFKVQTSNLAQKLEAAEDQMGEERSRRKGLESKCVALAEEIRNAETEVHLKTAELDDVRRKADSERMHYSQIMDDERTRRALETQQLRSEIVDELQQKETKFQADRARVAEDNYMRGKEEGKELGRRNGRIEAETKLQELTLEAQRAKTELDAYKSQVKELQEEGMKENRRLEAMVSTLKRNTDEATKTKAQLEYRRHTMEMRLKNASDTLLLQLTNSAHRLTRPAHPSDLMEILTSMKECKPIDFSFQAEKHQAEADEAFSRRYQWMSEELESAYLRKQSAVYHEQYLPGVTSDHSKCNAAVLRLWNERHDAERGGAGSEEAVERTAIEDEENTEFSAIQQFLADFVAQQQSTGEEERLERVSIEAEYEEFCALFAAFLKELLREREESCADETKARTDGEHEEETERAAAVDEMKQTFAALFAFLAARAEERDVVCGEETKARADEEQEEETERAAAVDEMKQTFAALFAFLAAQAEERDVVCGEETKARADEEQEEETERAAAAVEMKQTFAALLVFLAAQAQERDTAMAEETVCRTAAESEREQEWRTMMQEIELVLYAKLIAEQQEVMAEAANEEEEVASVERNEREAMGVTAAEGLAQTAVAVEERGEREGVEKENAQEWETSIVAEEPKQRPRPKPAKLGHFNDNDSDSDSEVKTRQRDASVAATVDPLSGVAKKKTEEEAPAPVTISMPKPSATAKNAAMFDSGSDKDEAPRPAPKKRKGALAKQAKPAKLFDDDDD